MLSPLKTIFYRLSGSPIGHLSKTLTGLVVVLSATLGHSTSICPELFNPQAYRQMDMFSQDSSLFAAQKAFNPERKPGRMNPAIRNENPIEELVQKTPLFSNQKSLLPPFMANLKGNIQTLKPSDLRKDQLYLHSRLGPIFILNIDIETGSFQYKKFTAIEAEQSYISGQKYIEDVVFKTAPTHSDTLRFSDIIINNSHYLRTEFQLSRAMRERSLQRSLFIFASYGLRSITRSDNIRYQHLKPLLKQIHRESGLTESLQRTFRQSEKSRRDPSIVLSEEYKIQLLKFIINTFSETGLDLIRLGLMESALLPEKWPKYSNQWPIDPQTREYFRIFLMEHGIETSQSYLNYYQNTNLGKPKRRSLENISSHTLMDENKPAIDIVSLNKQYVEALNESRIPDRQLLTDIGKISMAIADQMRVSTIPDLIVTTPEAGNWPLQLAIAQALSHSLHIPLIENALPKLQNSNSYNMSPLFLRKDKILSQHLPSANLNLEVKIKVEGRHILLLDALTLSGARMDRSIDILLANGAQKVTPVSVLRYKTVLSLEQEVIH